jgi:thiamine-phosphate pyrophosphorylase
MDQFRRAMSQWVNESMIQFLRLYLVTDRRQTRGRPLVEVVEHALQGGVRAVQLREPDMEARPLLELARQLCAVTARHGALLLVNDRIDVALACGASGVHLPSHSFLIEDARNLLGPDRLVGVSTHHAHEVAAAKAAGADFAVFGPVFETPSKQAYGPPAGLEALASATRISDLPVLAIGGITADRVSDVIARGAAGVAVIRAVLEAQEPAAAARALVDAARRPAAEGSAPRIA